MPAKIPATIGPTFTVPATQQVQAQISLSEAIKLAVTLIDRAADLQGGDYIDEHGNLAYRFETGGGGHSWHEEKIVRPATADDRAALTTMAKVRALLD